MESFKQKRANLLNDNPIASHGSWISKHSIAAGSPLNQGGSGKSPLYQDLKEGDYTVTKSTTGLSGEKIATEREAFIPGQEVEEYAKPGTPEYAEWEAAVKKNPSIEDKYKDRTVTQARDLTTEPAKKYKNIWHNSTFPAVDEVSKRTDSLSWKQQKAIGTKMGMSKKRMMSQFKKINPGKTFTTKTKEHQPGKDASQSLTEWTTVD